MRDIDSESLFNAAAAVLATIAVGVFVVSVEVPVSPVSKGALVVTFLAGVFAVTQRTDDGQLRVLGYGVVVTSAVVYFFEVVNAFELGDVATVVGLLAVAAVLFWARTALDADEQFVTGRQARYAAATLALLTVVVLVADVATGGVAYELRLQDDVTVQETAEPRGNELRAGSMVVTNPTPLPEQVETPRYLVCTAGNWSVYRPTPEPDGDPRPVGADIRVDDGFEDHVLGYSTRTYPVVVRLHGATLDGETFPVERTSSCPDDDTGAPYLAVYERPERGPGARPV